MSSDRPRVPSSARIFFLISDPGKIDLHNIRGIRGLCRAPHSWSRFRESWIYEYDSIRSHGKIYAHYSWLLNYLQHENSRACRDNVGALNYSNGQIFAIHFHYFNNYIFSEIFLHKKYQFNYFFVLKKQTQNNNTKLFVFKVISKWIIFKNFCILGKY